MTQVPRYLTASQVAERLETTADAVRGWAQSGKLTAIKLPSGQYRFVREDIEAIERGELPVSAA